MAQNESVESKLEELRRERTKNVAIAVCLGVVITALSYKTAQAGAIKALQSGILKIDLTLPDGTYLKSK